MPKTKFQELIGAGKEIDQQFDSRIDNCGTDEEPN